MPEKVVFYVSSGVLNTANKVPCEKYEFAFDRKVIMEVISQIRKMGTYIVSYFDFHGNEVPIHDVPESMDAFIEFVRKKCEINQYLLLVKRETEVVPSAEFKKELHLDLGSVVKVFDCQVPTDMKHHVTEKLGPHSKSVFKTDIAAPKKSESTEESSGVLIVTRLSNKDAVELLKNEQNSQIFIPVENGDYIQIKFRANFQLSDNGVFQWEKKPEDAAFQCRQVVVPVVLQEGEIAYRTGKSRDLMTELGTSFHASNEAENFEYSDHTYVKSSQDSQKQTEVPVTMDKYVKTDSLNEILNNFKAELMENILCTVTKNFKKCEISENNSTGGSALGESSKVGAASSESAEKEKPDGDDSDVLSFLQALSNIEERLYAVEDTVKRNEKSGKHNRTEYGYYGHCERRIRELNSLAKKTTLTMLRKRENGKMVELETDLFVISKSGYKIKMAPNSSTTIRISLLKYGKHKNTKTDKLELYPSMIPREIECCVKTVFKGMDKLPFQDKHAYAQQDIRFKTKDRTGKFRCFFNVTLGGKICSNPLRVDIRVRKLYATQNYLLGEDTNQMEINEWHGWLSKPSTSIFDVTPTEGDRSEREQLLSSARNANNDLIDEGIGGPQEGAFSTFSDSDDTDANEQKSDNVNDEGIDTQFPDAKGFHFDFDDDSDSSVSLLLDENEVRGKINDEVDVVKLPSCFLPNTESSNETIPVRVKRKINETKISTIPSSSSGQPTRIVKLSRSKSSPQKSEESLEFTAADASTSTKVVNNSLTPEKKTNSKKCDFAKSEDSASHPNKPILPNAENYSPATGKPETAKDPDYVALYPNLDSVQNLFESFIPKKEGSNTNQSSQKEVQSPIVILPEKVIEMTSNVFKTVLNSIKVPSDATNNLQKNFDETLSSLSRFVVNPVSFAESANKEPSTIADNQNSVAPNIASAPIFTSAENSTPQYTSAASQSTSTPQTSSSAANVWNYEASTSARLNSSDQPNFWEMPMTQSTSGSPPKRQLMETDFTSRDQVILNPVKVNVTPTSSKPNQILEENEKKTEIDNKYNELPPSVRSQLLKLNEMGFMNDNYNLFLIKKYPKDLSKVVESLVNYNL